MESVSILTKAQRELIKKEHTKEQAREDLFPTFLYKTRTTKSGVVVPARNRKVSKDTIAEEIGDKLITLLGNKSTCIIGASLNGNLERTLLFLQSFYGAALRDSSQVQVIELPVLDATFRSDDDRHIEEVSKVNTDVLPKNLGQHFEQVILLVTDSGEDIREHEVYAEVMNKFEETQSGLHSVDVVTVSKLGTGMYHLGNGKALETVYDRDAVGTSILNVLDKTWTEAKENATQHHYAVYNRTPSHYDYSNRGIYDLFPIKDTQYRYLESLGIDPNKHHNPDTTLDLLNLNDQEKEYDESAEDNEEEYVSDGPTEKLSLDHYTTRFSFLLQMLDLTKMFTSHDTEMRKVLVEEILQSCSPYYINSDHFERRKHILEKKIAGRKHAITEYGKYIGEKIRKKDIIEGTFERHTIPLYPNPNVTRSEASENPSHSPLSLI